MSAEPDKSKWPKAIGYVCSDLAGDRRTQIEAAIRRRATEAGYRLLGIVADVPVPDLLAALRRVDAVAVIVHDLEHIGGSPRSVCGFAALATVEPADMWRWGYQPDW
ncbi:hypothetical protein C8258_19965 [Nocardia sp. MDA0666]|uniref:hypothetical protein n=1 Tax=Nocardia sp. MDA0666 TaxID=2135448 RepID=UPI000D120858|nr:hypothetical protein [Nocardia sp. MDA0666]PSR66460.1 hypothetical protein C8258_19965 [Nocardia sp. MDA0666]